MKLPTRAVFRGFLPLLALAGAPLTAAAEEFKYYVWVDEQGIVHAEEEAPKGVDYQVRIIEDVNANVVPAEDFRPYGDLPVRYGDGSTGEAGQAGSGGEPPVEGSSAAAVPGNTDSQK